MSYVLQTTKLLKKFGGFVVTNNVSLNVEAGARHALIGPCLLYTSPSPRDRTRSRMPSSA